MDMIKGDAPGVLRFIEAKLHGRGAQPIVDLKPSRMTGLSLDDPRQFAMSWTTFGNADRDSLPHLEAWATTLTDAEQASRQFWPTIADYGLAYNLLILKKTSASGGGLEDTFGEAWTDEVAAAHEQGHLYVIDLSIFESVEPEEAEGRHLFFVVDGATRYEYRLPQTDLLEKLWPSA